MASFSGEIEFEVLCEKCGAGLSTREATSHTGRHTLHVDPCESCTEKERDEWTEVGREQGRDEALKEFKDKIRATIEVLDAEKANVKNENDS